MVVPPALDVNVGITTRVGRFLGEVPGFTPGEVRWETEEPIRVFGMYIDDRQGKLVHHCAERCLMRIDGYEPEQADEPNELENVR